MAFGSLNVIKDELLRQLYNAVGFATEESEMLPDAPGQSVLSEMLNLIWGSG